MPVYSSTVIRPRTRIRDHRPSAAPAGTPITVLIANASPLTNKDSQTISKTAGSAVQIKFTARTSPRTISSMACFPNKVARTLRGGDDL